MVWHAALWATVKKYNISTNLIRAIRHLCDKATNAVPFNGSREDWFQRQLELARDVYSYRPSSTLEDHEGTVSTGGKTITNLRFTDDIDGLTEEEEELAKLVDRLDRAWTAYGTEISAE